MAEKYYNATLRNLSYRLRRFKDELPRLLEQAIYEKEDEIVSAIADDQLYRRGITGTGRKIMDYDPYSETTIKIKKKKGQPTTRVTLRDTGSFHRKMHIVLDDVGFYVTSMDDKTQKLRDRYGDDIFRLTNKNLTRIVRSHIRKEIVKQLKQELRARK